MFPIVTCMDLALLLDFTQTSIPSCLMKICTGSITYPQTQCRRAPNSTPKLLLLLTPCFSSWPDLKTTIFDCLICLIFFLLHRIQPITKLIHLPSLIHHLHIRATILVWTLIFFFRNYYWILLYLISLIFSFIFVLDHSGIALIMLLLCIKMFGDSPWLNQVHILQFGFRAPKIWPLFGTPAVFPSQKPVLFLVGVFKILYGNPLPIPSSIWIGWHPSLFLALGVDIWRSNWFRDRQKWLKSDQWISILSLLAEQLRKRSSFSVETVRIGMIKDWSCQELTGKTW